MRIALMTALFLLLTAAVYRPPVPDVAQPNDNRVASGQLKAGVLHIALEARQSMWYPDGEHGTGIPIEAFAETGKAAQIPGPLIRVPLGTVVFANVRNAIPGSVLTMHGMVTRPTDADTVVRIPSGETRVIRFRAGAPGTFLYWATTKAKTLGDRWGPDSQLSGALIVDPPHSADVSSDRIFVIGQWVNVRKKNGGPNFNYELDAINGQTWPHTERLSIEKGSTVHWRVINASPGGHPLHLHGYYFSVTSRGDGLADTIYPAADWDRHVTELIEPGHTFAMTWHADRPGNWLFHCHLAYHIIGHVPVSAMLAGKNAIPDDDYENRIIRHAGMGGLILALTVHAPGFKDPQAAVAQRIKLTVEPGRDDRPDAPSFRYVLGDGNDSASSDQAIGPPIVLTRGVSYAIDVTNRLREPTAVHWHGLELSDSFYDGVAGYSGYGNRVAPMIDPGQTFEARVTPPRAGTFIYHAHMDDIWQLRGGLAGPLIVLEPGSRFDPATDHVFTVTTTHKLADALKIFVNGTSSPAAITCRAGVPQRLRFINMTTFWTNVIVSLSSENRTLRWSPLQIDGATLAANHRVPEFAVETVTIGQTRDYTFTPKTTGWLQLQFWPDPTVPNIVTVPVHVINTVRVSSSPR